MNSLLLWIGGLLVAVLGLMFAVPHVVDWNAYRGVFEEEASRILGRDVRVGGAVNLRLLPSPYVRFEKVRISDAGAALGEPFFRAESFTLWLSPTPLLKGAIEASELELDRPVLRLAVDAEGRGNWQALQITPGSIPLMPSDVVLQQVRIRDGLVSLKSPGLAEPLTLSGIEGEIAAASLDGPYRFRGLVDWYGSRRELRIGTSQRESDGRLHYKATVRAPDSGNLYSVDGVLSELTAKARHTGTLTARLPLATFFGGIMTGGRPASGTRASDVIDLKANLEGDIAGAKLTDLSFAFEHDGKPQLMNGDLSASWRGGLKLETRLTSRWLDLDQMVGQEGNRAPPVDTVRRLIGQVSSVLPPDGNSLLTIDVDQVNLGGEALSGVRLALARAGGLTSIGELRAVLPGNARGELRGTLGAPGASAGPSADGRPSDPAVAVNVDAFDGEMALGGSNYQRFAAWAGLDGLLPRSAGPASTGLDGPFAIDARMRLLPDRLTLSNAHVELGSRQVLGSADWSWGKEPRLEIAATGQVIDIAPFAPGSLDFFHLPSSDSSQQDQGPQTSDTGSIALQGLAARVAAVERAVGSLRVKLRADELLDGQTTLRNVDADLAIKSGAVSLSGLRLTASSGAQIDVKGELTSLRSKPVGTLQGWVTAGSADAAGTLIELLPSGARGLAGRWLAQSTKADLGFALTLGVGRSDRMVLTANGVIDETKAALELRLDGGLAQWREAPVEMSLDLEGASASTVLRQMTGRSAALLRDAPAWDDVAIHVRANGANASSILAAGQVEARSSSGLTSLAYSGRGAVTTGGELELSGALSVASPAVADVLALSGAPRRPNLAAVPVRGALDIERKAGAATLSTRDLKVGGSSVDGKLTLVAKGDRTRLEGQLTTDHLVLAGLLGLAQEAPAAGGSAAPSGSRGEEGGPATGPEVSPWSDAPFSLAQFEGIEGFVTVSAPSASLTTELGIRDAEARLTFTPGRIEIQSISGAALGGRFTARGTIEGVTAGAAVSLEARMTGAQLAQLYPSAGTAGTSGEANLMVTVTSRGLSPRAAMVGAVGRGEVEIRNGRVQGIGASLVETAALAAIEASDSIDRAGLERILRTERTRSVTTLGNRKLPIEIAEGVARVAALEIAAPEANLRNLTTVDLGQLKVDSEWRIAPRRALPGPGRSTGSRRDPLPAMSIVWTGPLGAITRAEGRLSIDQLERELSIRKLERDAERLEDLRRQDEERGRIEGERRQDSGDRISERGDGSTRVPVIQAPLPLPPHVVAPPPREAEAPAPLPRVTRPPAPRPQRDPRMFQNVFPGQQP